MYLNTLMYCSESPRNIEKNSQATLYQAVGKCWKTLKSLQGEVGANCFVFLFKGLCASEAKVPHSEAQVPPFEAQVIPPRHKCIPLRHNCLYLMHLSSRNN